MSAYKNLLGWLARKIARRQPTKIVRQQRGYPFMGSLEANFQDYARKNLIPLKGFGVQTAKKTVKKAPTKLKTVTGKQMRIPGMKSGGTLRKRNGNWIRK